MICVGNTHPYKCVCAGSMHLWETPITMTLDILATINTAGEIYITMYGYRLKAMYVPIFYKAIRPI